MTEWALPCDYLHCVTTLPHELNDLIAANPELLPRLLTSLARSGLPSERVLKAHREQVGSYAWIADI